MANFERSARGYERQFGEDHYKRDLEKLRLVSHVADKIGEGCMYTFFELPKKVARDCVS